MVYAEQNTKSALCKTWPIKQKYVSMEKNKKAVASYCGMCLESGCISFQIVERAYEKTSAVCVVLSRLAMSVQNSLSITLDEFRV